MKKYFPIPFFFLLVILTACSSGEEKTRNKKDTGSQQVSDPTELNLPMLIQRADNRFTRGDLYGARESLHQELDQNPDSFHAWYRLGVLDLLQDSLLVHERLEKAHALEPDHPGPLYFQGMVYRIVGRRDLGREPLVKSYALRWKRAEFNRESLPEYARASFDSFISRRLESAFREFKTSARADSTNAALWYWYARAAMDYKKGQDAISAVNHAKRLAPRSPNIAALQAVMQYRSRSKYLARDLAKKALALDPRNAMARHVLGHCQIDDNDYRQGLITLWHAMLEEPNETSYIDYVGNYLHSYANPHLGLKVIKLAVQGRGFLAEEHDWPGYTLR